MSGGELLDLRAKIDELTDAWLTVMQRQTGQDRSELVRQVLHEKAASEVRDATLLCNEMIARGIVKDSEGKTRL